MPGVMALVPPSVVDAVAVHGYVRTRCAWLCVCMARMPSVNQCALRDFLLDVITDEQVQCSQPNKLPPRCRYCEA